MIGSLFLPSDRRNSRPSFVRGVLNAVAISLMATALLAGVQLVGDWITHPGNHPGTTVSVVPMSEVSKSSRPGGRIHFAVSGKAANLQRGDVIVAVAIPKGQPSRHDARGPLSKVSYHSRPATVRADGQWSAVLNVPAGAYRIAAKRISGNLTCPRTACVAQLRRDAEAGFKGHGWSPPVTVQVPADHALPNSGTSNGGDSHASR
jgi:hypothetical protein